MNSTTEPHSIAREGYDAFGGGLRYEDCPYPYTGERDSDWWKWTAGWTLAKRGKPKGVTNG